MTRSCNDSLNDILDNLLLAALVEKPCKITKVHSQSLVDVEYFDNNQKDTLCKVPVKHIQTKHGFIYFGLKVGDCGTVRFFDNNVAEYYKSKPEVITNTGRLHNINDNLFSIGFYPTTEQYIFPEGEVVLGTTSGATINITGNAINITGGEITINGSAVTISGDTTIDGKIFLSHTHSNGNNGSPTGGVL